MRQGSLGVLSLSRCSDKSVCFGYVLVKVWLVTALNAALLVAMGLLQFGPLFEADRTVKTEFLSSLPAQRLQA